METISYISLFLTLLILLKLLVLSKNKKNLPPSPPSLPFLGHLHLFKKPLHLTLARLADLYGPILRLRFGSRLILVISSPSAVDECLSKNDITFANRPRLPSLKHVSYNYTSLGGASYGPHWRNLRRITTIELLSTHRLQSLSDIRANEVQAMVRQLFGDWKASSAEGFAKVELKSRLFALSLNVLTTMITGKRYNGEEEQEASEEARRFKELVEEGASLIGASNLSDFFPVLRWVDYQGVNKRSMTAQKGRDEFMQRLMDEHKRKSNEGVDKKTMMGVLLSLQKTDPEYYTDQMIKSLGVWVEERRPSTCACTCRCAAQVCVGLGTCCCLFPIRLTTVHKLRAIDGPCHAVYGEEFPAFVVAHMHLLHDWMMQHLSGQNLMVEHISGRYPTLILLDPWDLQCDGGRLSS